MNKTLPLILTVLAIAGVFIYVLAQQLVTVQKAKEYPCNVTYKLLGKVSFLREVFESRCGSVVNSGNVTIWLKSRVTMTIDNSKSKHLLIYEVNVAMYSTLKGSSNVTFTYWVDSNGTIYRFFDPLRNITMKYPNTRGARLLLANLIPMVGIAEFLRINATLEGIKLPPERGVITSITKTTYILNSKPLDAWNVTITPPRKVKSDLKYLVIVVARVRNYWFIVQAILVNKSGCIGNYRIIQMNFLS